MAMAGRERTPGFTTGLKGPCCFGLPVSATTRTAAAGRRERAARTGLQRRRVERGHQSATAEQIWKETRVGLGDDDAGVDAWVVFEFGSGKGRFDSTMVCVERRIRVQRRKIKKEEEEKENGRKKRR
ncbi:hypothetical protein M0R45_006871 [Rubus argutus]|uniref:Uncharacterized protein n=1 Tax=Rubus argutus TaxID=59490 RepID=A0AAW1YS09_RUBAR